jgi:hypothetical protein
MPNITPADAQIMALSMLLKPATLMPDIVTFDAQITAL